MNDGLAGCSFVVVIILFSIAATMSISAIVENGVLKGQLLKRGLKEYDRQTGRLVWTEKAGGNVANN